MKERTKLTEKWYIWEYIDDEGNYVKTKYREVEEISFYLRFINKWFTPCKECQRKLKELILNAEDMILGNKDYEPPVELRRRIVTDDNSWITLEERPATEKDEKRLGRYGIKREVGEKEPTSQSFLEQAKKIKELSSVFKHNYELVIPRGRGVTKRDRYLWLEREVKYLNDQRRLMHQILVHVAEMCILIGHTAEKYKRIKEILEEKEVEEG